MENVVDLCLCRGGGAVGHILCREGACVADLIKRDFIDHLSKIARIKHPRQFTKRPHRIRLGAELCLGKHAFNLCPVGRIVVDRGGESVLMCLERLEHFGGLFQIPRRHDDLRVARLPVGQRIGQDFGDIVVGVFHKSRARPRKETYRLDRVQQHGRIPPQVSGLNTGQAHFFFRIGAQQVFQESLPFQRDAHRIAAINQQPGLSRIGLGEIGIRVARGQLHGVRSAA